MRKILAMAILSALSASALADINNTSGSASNSVANSGSASYANTGAATAGNTQAVNVQDSGKVRYSGDYKVKNTPDVTTILPGATVPCFASIGGSVAGAGFGVGFASGLMDTDCTRRETARSLAALGKADAAVRLFCADKAVAPLLAECNVPQVNPLLVTDANAKTTTVYTSNPKTVKEMNGFNH